MSQKQEAVLFTAILIIAAYLRIVKVAGNPYWFSDEGTQLEIVRQLLHGRLQYLAVDQSVLLFSRLPLFTAVVAVVAEVGGVSMAVLRFLTGGLGVLSVALLVGLTRHLFGDRFLALLAGFVLAVFPQAVLYSRFGFSYNLLVPLLLGLVWGLGRSLQTPAIRPLLIAALCLGFGLISDLLMVVFLPVFLVWVGWYRRRDLAWSLPLVLFPFALYTAMSLLTNPAAFLFDLNYVLFRLTPPLAAQARLLVDNVLVLLGGAWIALGVAGLFLCRPLSGRRLIFLCLLPVLILARTTALFQLGAYYLIPFLPFFALGVAALIRYGFPLVRQTVRYRPLAVIIAGLPLLLILASGLRQVHGRYQTDIDPFLLNPDNAQAAAAFVNQIIRPEDVVIASPGLAWLLHGQVADFQMAVLGDGRATPHLPADLPPDRLAFNPNYRLARIVIIDNLWHNWAQFNIPGVSALMADVASWPELFAAGDIHVYENPGFNDDEGQ